MLAGSAAAPITTPDDGEDVERDAMWAFSWPSGAGPDDGRATGRWWL